MDRLLFKLVPGAVIALALCGCGADQSKLVFRRAPVVRSALVRTVDATGRVTPRNSSDGIPVGAQVTGKIVKLFVDYNSPVTNGQVVALIDPTSYQAIYDAAGSEPVHALDGVSLAIDLLPRTSAIENVELPDLYMGRLNRRQRRERALLFAGDAVRHRLRYLAVAVTLAMVAATIRCAELRHDREDDLLAMRCEAESAARLGRDSEESLRRIDDLSRSACCVMARAVARIVGDSPELLRSDGEMDRLRGILDVDEIDVCDARGIVAVSTEKGRVGTDFRSDGRTAEFLPALTDQAFELAQDFAPGGDGGAHCSNPAVKSARELKFGGMGLFMVGRLVDKVDHRRAFGRNIVTLTRHVAEEA